MERIYYVFEFWKFLDVRINGFWFEYFLFLIWYMQFKDIKYNLLFYVNEGVFLKFKFWQLMNVLFRDYVCVDLEFFKGGGV